MDKRQMDRRQFVKSTFLTLSASAIAFELFPREAQAAACPINPHLNGEIPTDANACVSSIGQFRHYHYLHVPQTILANPPAAGWTTISSMMVPELGVDEFFFRAKEIRKQFHCHQVTFTNAQLVSIASGKPTEVIAFISSNGKPTKNHTFLFNDPSRTFLAHSDALQKDAINKKFRTTLSTCTLERYNGVTVFNPRATSTIRDLATIEKLKGY